MSQVFLSYSSEDADVAHRVVRALRAGGIQVWMAPESIRPGDVYNEAIVAGLRSSDALAVLVSRAANGSRHVAREVALADDLRKTIYPVRIEAVQPSDGLTYYLSLPQWIEWHKDGEPALRPLLAALGSPRRTDAPRPQPATQRPIAPADDRPVLEVRRLSTLQLEREVMQVLSDGERILDLKNGESGRVRLAPGPRTLVARITSLTSPPVQVEEWSGEAVFQVLFGLNGPILTRLR